MLICGLLLSAMTAETMLTELKRGNRISISMYPAVDNN